MFALPSYVRASLLTLTTVGILLAGAPIASAGPNCQCRLYGEYFDIGTVLCIRGSLRRCEMHLNNTSWKQIGDICPQANLTPVPGSQTMTTTKLSSAALPVWFTNRIPE